ncbi:MAG: DUF6887 family protein [Spirulinaceae cyanobacterium]
MKVDFQAMTLRELKQYVLAHRGDRAAFAALMERVEAQPANQVHGAVDAEVFGQLLEQHRRAQTGRSHG